MIQFFLHAILMLIGIFIVVYTLVSATRTTVLPRSIRDPLSSALFTSTRKVFEFGGRARSYQERDRLMAFYAPVSLLLLPILWLTLVAIGYTFVYYAIGATSVRDAIYISGSSLFTLGTSSTHTMSGHLIMFSQAGIGLLLMALLVAYLPTMYVAFSRREVAVALLEYRAGASASGVGLISRFYQLGLLSLSESLWSAWEKWFVELEETHTSFPVLVFFRSPRPQQSWITAAGIILDASALTIACLDIPRDPRVNLCFRAGYTALQRIGEDVFDIPPVREATPETPITIIKDEFDEAWAQLLEMGVPLKPNREESWLRFKAMRAHYDTVLVSLAMITMAPEANWSSDRSIYPFPSKKNYRKHAAVSKTL